MLRRTTPVPDHICIEFSLEALVEQLIGIEDPHTPVKQVGFVEILFYLVSLPRFRFPAPRGGVPGAWSRLVKALRNRRLLSFCPTSDGR